MSYVLDACALIAVLKDEEGSGTVNTLFQQAYRGNITLAMSIVNLLEVYYGFIRDEGLDEATRLLTSVYETPLVVINALSPQVYREAARLKGTYRKISLADAVGVATAAELSAYFVTSDHHELEVIARQESSAFFWFR